MFMAVSGRRMKQGLFVIVAAFFAALFFYTQSLATQPVFMAKEGPRAIYKAEKGIALTFNIGWGDVQATPILDVLEREGVKTATFFLSGAWAERHPDTVKRIQSLGYEIGSLGYAYEDYTEAEEAKVKRDIRKSIEVLKKLGIKNVELLRSPTGHFDERTVKAAEGMGLTVIHWSVNSEDWKNPGTEKIIKKAARAKNGDIVLLHASDAATQTADALPAIISEVKKRGRLVTVSELIANGKVETKLVP